MRKLVLFFFLAVFPGLTQAVEITGVEDLVHLWEREAGVSLTDLNPSQQAQVLEQLRALQQRGWHPPERGAFSKPKADRAPELEDQPKVGLDEGDGGFCGLTRFPRNGHGGCCPNRLETSSGD
jgi:hypothetical protein